MASKQEFRVNLERLVKKYNRLKDENQIKSYNEAQTRKDFIEPMFGYLGWDMSNSESENEVTTEEAVSKDRVDLGFRLHNIPKMYLEAKSLKVDLDEWRWAEQAINYSWNKGVTWAVLTDFEGIKILNAEEPPRDLKTSQFMEIKVDEYLSRVDDLWLLSKESFSKNLLTQKAEQYGKLQKRKSVNEKLFEDMMNWRNLLTKGFNKLNKDISENLDEGVQRILDRLIFIRTAEDRQIESNVLQTLVRLNKDNNRSLYKELVKTFRTFDKYYNSKLFAEHYSETWELSNDIIIEIIEGLYNTKDGYRYDFSAISADVLGGIYEQYLGNVLSQQKGGTELTETKSKRKSHGIYYTPKNIVSFIVKETLGNVLKESRPNQIDQIKVLDMACGSGSFLTTAFDLISDYKERKATKGINFESKFDILKNNIYGVDLDLQAVEIAQLNLLLKALETKTLLPTLENNIRNGNSLISGDEDNLKEYFGEDWFKQKPFNWETEFGTDTKFDVVIGNPPYVRQESIKELKPYLGKYFQNTYSGVADLYTYFFERGLTVLKEGGYFGFIVSNKFIKAGYGKNLRKYLQENFKIIQVIDVFKDKVFKDATVDPCIIIIKKEKARKDHQIIYNYKTKVPQVSLNEKGWNLADHESLDLRSKLEAAGEKIKDWEDVEINIGIRSGLNEVFVIDQDKYDLFINEDPKNIDIIFKLIRGRDLSRYNLEYKNLYIIVIYHNQGKVLQEKYPTIFSYLKKYESDLKSRGQVLNGQHYWIETDNHPTPRYINTFLEPKIIYADISKEGSFYFDTNKFSITDTCFEIVGAPKSWVAILNSKLILSYIKGMSYLLGKNGIRWKRQFVNEIPMPKNTEHLGKYVDRMQTLKKELNSIPQNTERWDSLNKQTVTLEEEIEKAVRKCYGLD